VIPEIEAAAENEGIATAGVIETGVGEVAVVTEVTAATEGAKDLHLQDPSTARTTDAMWGEEMTEGGTKIVGGTTEAEIATVTTTAATTTEAKIERTVEVDVETGGEISGAVGMTGTEVRMKGIQTTWIKRKTDATRTVTHKKADLIAMR
jgi:hypothetical protein